MKLLRSNRFWLIIIGGILIVSTIAAIMLRQSPLSLARIYHDGMLIERLELTLVPEPYSFTVESGQGINEIAVEQGRIRISMANCPDESCVRQGWVSSGTVPIVCLPHRLVISFEGGSTTGFDAITG